MHHNPTLTGPLVEMWVPQMCEALALKPILNDVETMTALLPFFRRSVWTDEQITARHEKFDQAQRSGQAVVWFVREQPAGGIIGTCAFKHINRTNAQAEFGVILHRRVWGKGHAAECHLLALRYGFDVLQLRRVYFETDEHNHRMKRFFDKVGIPFARTTLEGLWQYELMYPMWRKVSEQLQQV